MTEFIITLPIFIMIFAGMGMLYRYNHEHLVARMKTNKVLVDKATAVNTIPGFIPNSGATIVVPTSFGDLTLDLTGSSELGMYWDSYLKAGVVEAMPGMNIRSPASPPKNNIEEITGMTGLMATDSWTNMLLNDMQNPEWDFSNWATILTSAISNVGVAPSIAAGIRYQIIDAEEEHDFSHPWTGSQTYNPGKLELAAPTAAHHRAPAVAMSRVAMNAGEPYQTCILEFDYNLCVGADSAGFNAAQAEAEADACADQAQIWNDCLQDCQANGRSGFCLTCRCSCSDDEPPSGCRNMGSRNTPTRGDVEGCSGSDCAYPPRP